MGAAFKVCAGLLLIAAVLGCDPAGNPAVNEPADTATSTDTAMPPDTTGTDATTMQEEAPAPLDETPAPETDATSEVDEVPANELPK